MKYPEEIKTLIAHCSFPPAFADKVRIALENNLGLPTNVEIFQPSEHRSSRNQCERKMGDYWPKELTREKVETFLANRGGKSLRLLLATTPVLDLTKKRIPKGVQIISLGADIYTQFDVLPDFQRKQGSV